MTLTDYVSVAQLQGFVRHAFTVAGGGLISAGYVTSDDWTAVGGGLAVLVGVAWSYLDKKVKINEETNPPAAPSA